MSNLVAVSAFERRKLLLDQRSDQILALLRENTSLKTISILTGMPLDHCKRECLGIIAEHTLDYDPVAAAKAEAGDTPVGLTPDSSSARYRLSGILYAAREADHALTLCMATGLSNKAQRRAMEGPYRHNWSIGEIERLARHLGVPFADLCRHVFVGDIPCPTA